MDNKIIGWVVVAVVVMWGIWYWQSPKTRDISSNQTPIKIGIITDLTGPAAYWGEFTRVGVQLAVQDLAAEGIIVQPVIEDYQLDTAKAASAAQKLSNVDKVQAVYVDFNPGAISASSVFKGTDTLYIYDAAIESPLKDSLSNFKTYLDYRAGCQAVAQKFKDADIRTIGVLKPNQEFGELCLQGVQNVYGSNILINSFNIGDVDIRTQITKFKVGKVEALIGLGFPGDTSNILQAMRQLGLKVPFGTAEDGLIDQTKDTYAQELKGAWSFGFRDNIDPVLIARFVATNGGKQLGSNYAAALAYLHIKQLAHALASCNADKQCAIGKMEQSPIDNKIGFQGFINRIAQLQISVRQY